MTPAEFKSTIAAKGWSMANLAWRWGISPEYLSRIAARVERDTFWNDAAAGLPVLSKSEATALSLQRRAAKRARKT